MSEERVDRCAEKGDEVKVEKEPRICIQKGEKIMFLPRIANITERFESFHK